MSPSAAAGARPNLVVILADDLGWRDLSIQGSDFYETPNLDAIARAGTRFFNAYAASAVCSPSRASLMTGSHPARLGITDWIGARAGSAWDRNTRLLPADYRRELPSETTSLAEAFKAAGYATFFAGKWHLGDGAGDAPEAHGFDINLGGIGAGSPPGGYFSPYRNPRLKDGPPGEYLPLRLGRETAQFVASQRDRPFLAVLSFYSVHGPAQTTRALWAKYRDKVMTGPQPVSRFAMERLRAERQVQDHPIYGGMVEAMDQAVGLVLAALRENGLQENTIVVFTSDNGGVSSGDAKTTSNRPLRGGKGYQWEGGLRVPLFIAWPAGLQSGQASDVRVTGADLFPTLLDLAGVGGPVTQILDGTSLRPLLTGGNIAVRDLFWHYPHYSNQGGEPSAIIVRDDWKLIHYYEDGRDELYRLSVDPGERTDEAGNHPGQTAALRHSLDAWLGRVGAVRPAPNPRYDAALAVRARERQRDETMPQLEREAAAFLRPDWTPAGGWWETRGR